MIVLLITQEKSLTGSAVIYIEWYGLVSDCLNDCIDTNNSVMISSALDDTLVNIKSVCHIVELNRKGRRTCI